MTVVPESQYVPGTAIKSSTLELLRDYDLDATLEVIAERFMASHSVIVRTAGLDLATYLEMNKNKRCCRLKDLQQRYE